MKPKINSKSPESDLCMTPPYAIKPLIDLVGLSDYAVWEPASGDGDLLSGLLIALVNTIGSTLEDGKDFFDSAVSDFYYDTCCSNAIVTNPPFSIKLDWIERCYQLTNNWALLLPIEVLGGAEYQKLFEANGGVSVLTFNSRIDFKMTKPGKDGNGNKWGRSSAQFPTAWFIHGFNLEPDKIYRSQIKEEKAIFKKMHRMLGS